VSEEAIWQHLELTTTTPLKREWMSWLVPILRAKRINKLQAPRLCIGCDVAVCTATDEDLDMIVTTAVKEGRVGIR
jgi:hypothetical protein